jgi:hypothetical protein
MSDDDVDRYWQERAEREMRSKRRERRRERRLYALGVTMLWIATIGFAFEAGYSQAHQINGPGVLLTVGGEMAFLFGGLLLMAANAAGGEKLWIEDPEAADRWREDLRRERLRH